MTLPRPGFASSARALACGVVALAWTSPAGAEKMDFALERLVENPGCRTTQGAATSELCIPDEDAFKLLANQYATAILPTASHPAHTPGFGGFEISLEGAFTTMDSGADYLQRGTRGPVDESTARGVSRNDAAASVLQLYSLRIVKGFGFGLETGMQFGVLPTTSLIAGGADVRLALLEGFREGALGYVPDLAVSGSVRTITGTPQMQLTTASVQGVLSKPFTIAESGELTPWLGYQYAWVFADSGLIDFTPATDALQACGYVGPNQPGTPGADEVDRDGEPICEDGTVNDFNNNQVFDPARLERQRLYFGARYRHEMLTFGGQFLFDVVPIAKAQNDGDDSDVFSGQPAQITFALQVGAAF